MTNLKKMHTNTSKLMHGRLPMGHMRKHIMDSKESLKRFK